MPRKPNAVCDVCGRPGYQHPGTKTGYRCLTDRRALPKTNAEHGTPGRYRHGCRCGLCRAYHVREVRKSQERYREKHGRLPSSDWRARNGAGPVYWVPASVREGVYERDNYVCQICHEPTDPAAEPNGDRFPSLDHIIPQSHGGEHTPENLRTAHRVCNARRGAPADARL